MEISIGIKAPDFSAVTDGDGRTNLSDYNGKWIVLYFYPKDNTSGCSKEACGFRDNMERITSRNAVVIGVSPDGAKSHDKFKEKFNLNFLLAADPEKEICNLYGVMGEKSMYGKKYLGVIRSTFIINPDGGISYIWKNVKVEGHVDDVISKLEELQK